MTKTYWKILFKDFWSITISKLIVESVLIHTVAHTYVIKYFLGIDEYFFRFLHEVEI